MQSSAHASTGAPAAPMKVGRLRRVFAATVGQKALMAASGLLGTAFVVVHMAGNLQMFKPVGARQAMHDYAVGLRSLGPLLWVARAGLVVVLALHVAIAVSLIVRNRAARPADYARRVPQASTIASRTMRVGGLFLLAFIVFHVADMTWGVGHPSFAHLDPYHNLRLGFQRWWAVVVYVAAAAFVGLHLSHGAWASWLSLGARRTGPHPRRRPVALVLAWLVAAGLAAVPIAAALGAFPVESNPAQPGPAGPASPLPAVPPVIGRGGQ